MRVIANNLRSGAERRVADWLEKCQTPGVAITNCYIAGQEADLVILTPHTTVIGEVKGVAPQITSGVLAATANSRWKITGFDGDPVKVRANDTTPYDQVREGLFKLKSLAAQVGGSAFITGLVLVVPSPKANLQLEERSAPQGCTALLCDGPAPLHGWFYRSRQHEVTWTAEQAYALIEALEFGERITVADLANEGFPLRSHPLPAAPTPPAPAPARPAAASRPPGSTAPRQAPPQSADRVADLGRRPAESAPRPVIAQPSAPRSAGHRGIYQTAAAFAAIAVLGGGIWLLAQSSSDTEPQQVGNEQQLSSVTEEPAAPPPPPPAPEGPLPAPAPAPAKTGCFPFQSNC